jgi:protein dithiol oxidoreductase (disulfide-forming)
VSMNARRRALVIAMSLAPFGAWAQQGRGFGELNPPQPVEASGKIEVLEFFWYGCPHCYNLEPAIEVWMKKLAPDVAFRRVPAIFNERWAHDAAIFYALEAMGVLEKLHKPLFDAIHKDRLRTDNTQAMTEWLQKNGVDSRKFNEALKSFGVQSKTKRAAQMTLAYKIEGTPAMAVQGRYTVSADQAGTRDGMLQTVDQLVDIVRKKK